MEKYCYIKDFNGDYFCKEADVDYFLNVKFKTCGGRVCAIGTKEELEGQFGTLNILQNNSINIETSKNEYINIEASKLEKYKKNLKRRIERHKETIKDCQLPPPKKWRLVPHQ